MGEGPKTKAPTMLKDRNVLIAEEPDLQECLRI
jgi:hypothetical protein